jgi:hypothetical protein
MHGHPGLAQEERVGIPGDARNAAIQPGRAGRSGNK